MESNKIGRKAPAFELECVDSEMKRFTATQEMLKGAWTLIFFYPRDFSFI